jgi:hypothetical protein
MTEIDDRFRETLSKIVPLADSVVEAGLADSVVEAGYATDEKPNQQSALVCTPKNLPRRLLVHPAKTAVKINPVTTGAVRSLRVVDVSRRVPSNGAKR